jgi:hypothetical protein
MTELLRSLRADLSDRRMLPILVALGLALAGALAYAVLGGGSSAKPLATAGLPAPSIVKGPSLPVSQAPANPNAAVAETTEGVRYQRRAGSHNPFVPLASPKSQTSTTSASTAAKASSGPKPSASSGGSGTGSSGSSTAPIQPQPKPKPKVTHKSVATASLLFGPAPTVPGQLSQLIPYASVKQGEPLPSAANQLITFKSVVKNAGAAHKSAIFALDREAILKGPATCLPSPSQCESIELELGGTEELSYLEPTEQTVTYELVLEGVDVREVTARIARRHHRGYGPR